MRKLTSLLAFLFFLATILVSCSSDYGKKIKIEGTKGEVYYKPGIAGEEAKKVGDFLKDLGFLTNEKGASIQVIKEHEGLYTVRFVYNKEYYEKTDGLENLFKQYGVKISRAVFHGANVNIALADNQFKDYKVIPYDEALSKSMDSGSTGSFQLIQERMIVIKSLDYLFRLSRKVSLFLCINDFLCKPLLKR